MSLYVVESYSVTFLEMGMQMRAGIIASLVNAIALWILNGIYHGAIAHNMMMELYKPYESVMKTEADMGGWTTMLIWLIPLFLMSWYLLKILTQVGGKIAIGRSIKWAAATSLLFCGTQEMGMNLWFRNYPMNASLMNCAADLIIWVIGGTIVAAVYNALYKSS